MTAVRASSAAPAANSLPKGCGSSASGRRVAPDVGANPLKARCLSQQPEPAHGPGNLTAGAVSAMASAPASRIASQGASQKAESPRAGHGATGSVPLTRCPARDVTSRRRTPKAGGRLLQSLPARTFGYATTALQGGAQRAGVPEAAPVALNARPARCGGPLGGLVTAAGDGIIFAPVARTPGERGAGVSSVLLPSAPPLPIPPQTKEAAGVLRARR